MIKTMRSNLPRHRTPFPLEITVHDKVNRGLLHSGERSVSEYIKRVSALKDTLREGAYEEIRRVVYFYTLTQFYFILRTVKYVKYVSQRARVNPIYAEQSGLSSTFPIRPDGVVSWYAGLFPSSVWFRPAKSIPRKIDVSKLFGVNKKYDNQVMVGGEWPTTQYHLQDMCNNVLRKITEDGLFSILGDVMKVTPELSLELPRKSDLALVKVNPDALPGAVSGFYSSSKGAATSWAIKASRRMWDDVYSGRVTFNPTVYSLGARGRRHDWDFRFTDSEMKNDIDTRLVQFPEFPVAILESVFHRQLTYYLHDPEINVNTWFKVGWSPTSLGWVDFLNQSLKSVNGFEGDWKSFDSLFFETLTYVSYAFLRSYFRTWDSVADRFLSFLALTFQNRLVVTPGDMMYNVNQGVPSGSTFTADIDTIGNIIVWMYIFKRCPIFNGLDPVKDVLGWCGGDDFLFMFRRETSFDVNELEEWVGTEIGWKMKDPILGPIVSRCDPEESLSFYKLVLNPQLLPTRRVAEIVKSINCPERKPRATFQKFLAQTAIAPPRGRERDVFLELFKRIGRNISNQDILTVFCGMLTPAERANSNYLELSMDRFYHNVVNKFKYNNDKSTYFERPLYSFVKQSRDRLISHGVSPGEVAKWFLNTCWNKVAKGRHYEAPPLRSLTLVRDIAYDLARNKRKDKRARRKAS